MNLLLRTKKIVEVTGVPGIGKSALCSELTSADGYTLFSPSLTLPWRSGTRDSGPLSAFETQLGRFYLVFLGLSSISAPTLFKIISAVRQQKVGTFGVLRIIANVLQKLGLPSALATCKGAGDTLIIDEGYSHLFYNLGLSDPQLLNLLIRKWKLVDIVILVEGPTKKVRDQLLKRGHWRLDQRSIPLAEFLEVNFEIQAMQLAALQSALGPSRLVRMEIEGDKVAQIRQLLEELLSHEKQTNIT